MALKSKTIVFFIDSPSLLNPKTDTSISFMRIAAEHGYEIAFFTLPELFYKNGKLLANLHFINLEFNQLNWYQEVKAEVMCLYEVAAIIIRKNPPFDQNYLYATYLLELAVKKNVLVSNNPISIRNINEKIAITHFPALIAPSLISNNIELFLTFLEEHKTIVLKPLDNYGGHGIIKLENNNPSASEIISLLLKQGQMMLAQKFMPEVKNGDKRIVFIANKPIPYFLRRTPAKGNFLANTRFGSSLSIESFSKQDHEICEIVSSFLSKEDLDFVGIDIIDGFISEINVTSVGATLYFEEMAGVNIAKLWWERIDARLKNSLT